MLASFGYVCNAQPSVSDPLTYSTLIYGCETHCKKMFPTINTAPDETSSTEAPNNYQDNLKLFACLDACRMAAVVYPKTEAEIHKFTYSA